jgi:hypothetical protein
MTALTSPDLTAILTANKTTNFVIKDRNNA